MPRGKRTLGLLLPFVLLMAAPSASAARSVPQGFYGVVYSGNVELLSPQSQAKLWDRLAAGGAETARVVFNWELTQSAKGGPYYWNRIDQLVIEATKRRMTILPILKYAPRWAKRYPTKMQSPPKDPAQFAAFARAVVARYGPGPTASFWLQHPELPRRPIRQFQVWDEPEISFHWWREPRGRKWGASDARDYVRLLRATYKAIHSADSGAKVITAALSIDSWKNLEKIYTWAPDFKGSFDVAALQGYSGTADFVPTILRRFRAVLNRHGDSNIPMEVTEMTWPAAKGKSHPHYTTGYMSGFLTDQQGAAKRLTKAYKLLRGIRNEVKLNAVVWYTGVSAYATSNEFEYSGLLTFKNDLVRQFPVYSAYRKSAQAAEGCIKTTLGLCQ